MECKDLVEKWIGATYRERRVPRRKVEKSRYYDKSTVQKTVSMCRYAGMVN